MSERPFLDLLAQDASADAYEELVRETGRRGAAEAELRRLRLPLGTGLWPAPLASRPPDLNGRRRGR